jgi:hypothetical protein
VEVEEDAVGVEGDQRAGHRQTVATQAGRGCHLIDDAAT